MGARGGVGREERAGGGQPATARRAVLETRRHGGTDGLARAKPSPTSHCPALVESERRVQVAWCCVASRDPSVAAPGGSFQDSEKHSRAGRSYKGYLNAVLR